MVHPGKGEPTILDVDQETADNLLRIGCATDPTKPELEAKKDPADLISPMCTSKRCRPGSTNYEKTIAEKDAALAFETEKVAAQKKTINALEKAARPKKK